MEAQKLTVNIIVAALDNPSNKSLCQSVIKFLDNEDIRSISKELEKNQTQNSFSQLIRTYYFLLNYLNKVDRTFYYSFYEEQQFRDIQTTHTALLANKYSNCFLQFPRQYQKCFEFMKGLFPEDVNPCQLIDQIQRMITDTDIPMPKLKRQNQGIFCKTSFQNYLIYLKFKNQCFSDYEQAFETLNSYLESQQQIYLQKLFMKAAKDRTLSKKVRFLRFTPYEITYESYQSYLIQKNSLHNFLVAIFALTDVWLNSIRAYIDCIEDPFHRYIQLITRYSIYRNFVISVEENLSFVFQKYDQLYSEVFGRGKPMYRFWRPAMTKWMLKFQKYHAQCSSIFYYCLNKLRTETAIKYLQLKQQQKPDLYMKIKNKLSLREYDIEINETLMPDKVKNGVQGFFQKDRELYQLIIVEFMEYMIDLSINQETVHWCGHSEQILSEPYISFEKYFMAQNKIAGQLLEETIPKRFLPSINFKPVTLKKIIQCYNVQLSDSSILSESNQELHYDCKTNDQILKYFNLKANIKYLIPEQQMYFYSITPLVPADELLTKSISTACDSAFSEQEESDCEMQYFSQNSSVEGYANQNQLKDFDNEQSNRPNLRFGLQFQHSQDQQKQLKLITNKSVEQTIKKSRSKNNESLNRTHSKCSKKGKKSEIKIVQSSQVLQKIQKHSNKQMIQSENIMSSSSDWTYKQIHG